MWEILNEHLENIRGTKGLPVLWCVCDTVSPEDHMIEPALYYIRIDEELMVIFPMILASYAGPCEEATADDIHVRDSTTVYHTDNNIFSVTSAIFSGSALWMHSKCTVKTCEGRLSYKQIYIDLFVRNALGNCDDFFKTTIGHLK